MVIYGASREDSGFYKCEARNGYSKSYNEEEIVVEGKSKHSTMLMGILKQLIIKFQEFSYHLSAQIVNTMLTALRLFVEITAAITTMPNSAVDRAPLPDN